MAAEQRDRPARAVELRVPFATLLKLAFFALLVVAAIKLWPVIVMVIVAALLAVMLDPFVDWLQRHHMNRGVAIGIVAVLLFSVLAAFLFLIVPETVGQLQDLGRSLPRIASRIAQAAPAARPLLDGLVAETRRPLGSADVQQWLTRGLMAGRFIATGMTAVILVLVLAIYFLVEGRTALDWLIAFAPDAQQAKIRRTLAEVNPIVFAYMRGQAITCTLCGTTALVTSLSLHLPGAVPLAVLAFFADLVPVVGTIVMTVPAVAVAAAVSPLKAAVVLVVYLTYHLVESYWIIPRVYGTQMRLSTLTALVAVLVGGTLQGALGAVLILPFVAAYPVVERIWLRKRLGDTVEEHDRIARE